jgi:hypothetical protein
VALEDRAYSRLLLGNVPTVAAGMRPLANGGGGLDWLGGPIILGLLGAVSNAWVLAHRDPAVTPP